MQNMLNAPYTQAVMQQLATNPDMAQNIIASNRLMMEVIKAALGLRIWS